LFKYVQLHQEFLFVLDIHYVATNINAGSYKILDIDDFTL